MSGSCHTKAGSHDIQPQNHEEMLAKMETNQEKMDAKLEANQENMDP
jgi:hypothetical protein